MKLSGPGFQRKYSFHQSSSSPRNGMIPNLISRFLTNRLFISSQGAVTEFRDSIWKFVRNLCTARHIATEVLIIPQLEIKWPCTTWFSCSEQICHEMMDISAEPWQRVNHAILIWILIDTARSTQCYCRFLLKFSISWLSCCALWTKILTILKIMTPS